MLELRNKIEKIRTISECEIRMPVIKKKTENSLKKKFGNSPFLLFESFQSRPCLLCVILCSSAAKMTLFTGGRCGCTTAESSFTKLGRKFFAHSIHGIDHLLQRDELGDTGQ